jgi:hypothetical protein
MHHRHLCFVPACILLLVCAFTTASFGQLPSSIVTSPDPSAQRDQINAFVDTQVNKLLIADPASWGAGRALLVGEVSKQGATPGFYDVYADSINKYLLPLATNKDPRVRLNAAIVAARVASKAANGRLAPVTLAFLKDSSDAVVLWGLQSAKYVVPALLAVRDATNADAIAKAVVLAAQNHMTPAVIEEAYRTLLIDPALPQDDPHYMNDITAPMLSGFLPNPMALYEYRIKLYDDVAAPMQPVADTWASTFFVNEKVWAAQSPTQQGQTLNLMLGLLKGAAKQNGAAATPEMVDVMKRTGQAFQVVSRLVKKPALTSAADKVALITSSTAPDEIDTAINNLEAAVKALALPAATARTP